MSRAVESTNSRIIQEIEDSNSEKEDGQTGKQSEISLFHQKNHFEHQLKTFNKLNVHDSNSQFSPSKRTLTGMIRTNDKFNLSEKKEFENKSLMSISNKEKVADSNRIGGLEKLNNKEQFFSQALGDHILISMNGQKSENIDDSNILTSKLSELVDKLVDKLMIRIPKNNSESEVLIRLKGANLHGSEIKITRSENDLIIKITTFNLEAQQLITQSKAELQINLESKLNGTNIKIDSTLSNQEQGNQQYDSQQNRSRNPYIVDLDEENT